MSQCDRILAALKDRQWHRMEEIHQEVGFCRLNSRVSELRQRGYEIECDKTGGVYRYRLLREPDVQKQGPRPCAPASPIPQIESSGSLSGAGLTVDLVAEGAAQLSIWQAA